MLQRHYLILFFLSLISAKKILLPAGEPVDIIEIRSVGVLLNRSLDTPPEVNFTREFSTELDENWELYELTEPSGDQ